MLQLISEDIKYLKGNLIKYHQRINDEKRTYQIFFDYDIIKKELEVRDLSHRFQLLNKILFNKVKQSEIYTIAWNNYATPLPKIKELYFLLLTSILNKLLNKELFTPRIFEKHLKEWEQSILKKKMRVSFRILNKNYEFEKNFRITQDFSIKKSYRLSIHYLLNEDPYFEEFKIGPYLNYKTLLSFSYQSKEDVTSGDTFNWESLRTEMKTKLKEIKDNLKLLYLNKIFFRLDNYIILLPWWFRSEITIYNSLQNDTIFPEPSKIITRNIFPKILNLFLKAKNSCIFDKNEFSILSDTYYELFNREKIRDIILDFCSIFEFLFTRGWNLEVSFRMPLNAALFLSKNWKSFTKNYQFFRDLYDIRSTIIHGSNWEEKLKNLLKNDDTINDSKQLENRIKNDLNSCIVRLIKNIQFKYNFLEMLDNNLIFFIMESDIIEKDYIINLKNILER